MPSPSLSPSITSLLNDDASNSSLTPFTESDYFSAPAPTPPPAQAARPPKRPRTSSDSVSVSPTLTLAMHPPPAPAPPAPPARPTSSSSSSSSSSAKPSRPFAPPPPPPASLEPSIFNVEPIDEFTREVADWLWGFCAPLDWDKVEIEAKIGLLVDQRQGGHRVYLPVPTEAILTDDTGLRFQSNMTVSQHKHFNQLLNARVVETSHPSLQATHSRIVYSHTHELDSFHTTADRRKVRVTRNVDDKKRPPAATATANGSEPVRDWRAIEKVRVADMNVFSPKRCFDWRVSISLENPVNDYPTTPASHSRRKDRISYSHQLYTIDLTQVTTPDSSSSNAPPSAAATPPTHELEIEFKSAKKLLLEAEKESRGEKNWYLEGVQGMLNNVRMLIRNASDP